jgi:ATP-dependent RNA helicase DDX19/DBP5
MEKDPKDQTNTKELSKEEIEINTNKEVANKEEGIESRFEEMALKNKELQDDDNDQAVVTKTGQDVGIENLLKDDSELFNKDASWDQLGVREDLVKGLIEMNFTKPSKIQSTTYPLIMKKPFAHLVAQSPNGSGKTGAFGLGTLSRIDDTQKSLQAVIFAHSREMVIQISDVLKEMAKYTSIEVTALLNTSKDVEIGHVVVSTPGNFENLFFKGKKYSMENLKILVLDEADYMFTNDVALTVSEKCFKYFQNNNLQVQVLFFSATFNDKNLKMIKKYFKKAYMLEIKKEALTLKNVRQMYYKCNKRDEKVDFIEQYLKRNIEQERVIIFVNTRDFTEKLSTILRSKGYKVYVLMGGQMDPKERDLTVKKFRSGEIQILITTNLLARGYDERLVKLIINFDMPLKQEDGKLVADTENYLHRIGRTGRFGTKGIGLTLVSSDQEMKQLKEIQDYYQSNIEEIKSMDDLITEFKKLLKEEF